jgi:heme/copper-type cytochrome/quinol oxidase subunit 2
MGSLIQPNPVNEEHDSSWRIIVLAVIAVIVVVVVVALALRQPEKKASGPPPYVANLALSDFQMSAAQNFVGATVSYVDGTITNKGDKTVTHIVVEVNFKDDMGQIVQRENIPMQVLRTDGPYPEAVDFSVSPLAPSQSKPFRLTFESISAQWSHQYPEILVTDVATK